MEIINMLAYALCSASIATYILIAALSIHHHWKQKNIKKNPELPKKHEDATQVLPEVWKTIILTSSLEDGESQ